MASGESDPGRVANFRTGARRAVPLVLALGAGVLAGYGGNSDSKDIKTITVPNISTFPQSVKTETRPATDFDVDFIRRTSSRISDFIKEKSGKGIGDSREKVEDRGTYLVRTTWWTGDPSNRLETFGRSPENLLLSVEEVADSSGEITTRSIDISAIEENGAFYTVSMTNNFSDGQPTEAYVTAVYENEATGRTTFSYTNDPDYIGSPDSSLRGLTPYREMNSEIFGVLAGDAAGVLNNAGDNRLFTPQVAPAGVQ